jgi:hypothetical protein
MKIDITVRTLWLLALALLVACQRTGTGTSNSCPYSDTEYSRQIGAASNWNELYALYQANSIRCSPARAPREYSHRLVQQLAKQWQDLPQLAQSVPIEPPLASFLYGHITRDADAADLKLLLNDARTECPANANAVCEQLAWRAQAALIAQGVNN